MADGVGKKPAVVLAAHGAGSSPGVFGGWERLFCVPFVAVDLQESLEVARAGMQDYADRVVATAAAGPQPVALIGWSMGGLVVLLAAKRLDGAGAPPVGLVLLEASAPGEVAGFRDDVQVADGVFDPEAGYGTFPPGQSARAESARARAERKRGISVPSLPSPTLVVSGREFSDERGARLASRYAAQHVAYPALGHWDLVCDRRVALAAATFLGVGQAPTGPVDSP